MGLNNVFAILLGLWASYFLFNAKAVKNRGPSQENLCLKDHRHCPFFVIGHRGAPYIEAENTIKSFAETLSRKGNALEIDLAITEDKHVVVFHDRDPSDFIAILRQASLEKLGHIPVLPKIWDPMYRPVEELTLDELRTHFGFKKNEGFFKALFGLGKIDPNVVIPTYEDFMKWAIHKDELKFVVLDVKLGKDQVELAWDLAERVGKLTKGVNLIVYLSSPYPKIYEALRDWHRHQNDSSVAGVLLDLEKKGAMEKVFEVDPEGLMTGKTILRRWNSYVKEMKRLLKHRKDGNPLWPIISWTIDNQFRAYRLMQLGVDGIITNRPRDLSRLATRHFKDHSSLSKFVAMCWQNNRGGEEWNFCTSGKQVDPFLPIGKREVKRWVCEEGAVDPYIKDIFGCSLFNDMELKFQNEMDNSGNVNIWFRPGKKEGKVIVARAMEEYGRDKTPFLLSYRQKKCRDGFLNYDCEYKIHVEYLDKTLDRFVAIRNANINYDSSFTFISNVPKETSTLRVTLFETDNGKKVAMGKTFIEFSNGRKKAIRSEDKTFKGELSLKTFVYEDLHTGFEDLKTFALEFKQKKCRDGFLNYDCEYQIEMKYKNENGEIEDLKGRKINFDSSFSFYGQVPKGADNLIVTIYETDDGKRNRNGKVQQTFEIPLRHGERKEVVSKDRKTFRGLVTIKLVEYDEDKQHSEGLNFTPHGVKY